MSDPYYHYQDNSPRSIDQVMALWLKAFQMDESFFAEEANHPNWIATFFGVMLYSVVISLIIIVAINILPLLGFSDLFSGYDEFTFLAISLLCGLVFVPVSFYLSNGVYYIGAKLLGGTGSFNTQTYLMSLFTVPLGILVQAISLIPCLGALASLLISLYMILLTLRVMRVTHGLTFGRTLLSVFYPYLLVFIPLCLLTILSLTSPNLNSVLQQIFQSLRTPTP
jgi:hypothetical protein